MQPKCLIHARDQEQQRYAIVFQNIAQPIKPVIALAIRQHDVVVIQRLDKAGRIAARRDVVPPRTLRAQQHEGAGGNEGARWRIQPISGFIRGGFQHLIIQGFERGDGGDGVLVHGGHRCRTPRQKQEKRHMPSVETLETRNRDALDFHNVAVWSIHNPLAEANASGQRFANCHIDGSFHSIYLK